MEWERRSQAESMGAISRRSLLKGMGLTLTAWGLGPHALSSSGESRFAHWAQSSSMALAAPARRKYALLIGIDQYNNESQCPSLRGCVQDLELQRNLLIHRFGFQPADILTLKNRQATRSGVRSALLDHLLSQVTAEDVVFVHFSGYGSQVQTAEGAETQRTLVLHDSCTGNSGALLKDWPESTLLLLLRALPTERIVAVLDTGYRVPEDSPVSVGVNLRSRPSPAPASFDAQTLELQATLQEQIKARGILPNAAKTAGIVLQTTDWVNDALEFEGQAGFVGLMTYALSQQLWRSPGDRSWREVMAQASGRLVDELDSLQNLRLLEGRVPGRSLSKSGLIPQGPPETSGVVLTARNNNDIDLWLGGLSSTALNYCAQGSLFELLPELLPNPIAVGTATAGAAPSSNYLQIYQRSGLNADAKRYGAESGMAPPAVGALIREQVRVIPRGIELAIAIDQRLDRIERVDATSALTSIPNLSVVALQNQPADYIFGRVEPAAPTLVAKLLTDAATAPASMSDVPADPEIPSSQYGLLTLGRGVLPATVGASDEAIKTAVQRLQPHLETLRAAKNIEILENGLTTQLGVQARWEVVAEPGAVNSAAIAPAKQSVGPRSLLTLSAGDRLRYLLKRDSDRPLYYLILSFDPRGDWRPIAAAHLITPLSVMDSNQMINVGKRKGLMELYTLCSIAPFEATYQFLSAGNQRSLAAIADQPIRNPFALSEAILQDLNRASQPLTPATHLADNLYGLNLSAWAGFRQSCRIQLTPQSPMASA